MRNDYSYHRFAITVSRKIGNAVQRNYIKRKMKEYFRLNQHLLPGETNYDVWVVIKQRFDRENADEVEMIFCQSLRRINTR